MDIRFEPVTRENLQTLVGLTTTPEQERFVAPNAVSMAQAWLATERAWPRLITADGEPVGFVMLELGATECGIWRFMIDHLVQKRGHGRAAMERLIGVVRDWGYPELVTSCVEAPGGPLRFYEGLGFARTGAVEDGEVVLRLALGGEPSPHLEHAHRYDGVAAELERAAAHARVAADHLRDQAVPSCCAHAFAAQGHGSRARALLEELSRIHADLSRP